MKRWLPPVVALLVLLAVIWPLEYPAPFRFADFILLYSAGHQLVHLSNPWAPYPILLLERLAGWRGPLAFMYNLPPALFIALPFGFFSYAVGSLIFFVLSLSALTASIWMLLKTCKLYGIGYWLAAGLFPPAVACLVSAQTATFLLLGITLFLYFHERKPWLAGIGLWLCILKPHLFVPFGLIVVLWSIRRREYRIVAAAILLALACAVLVFYLDPLCWEHYITMMKAEHLSQQFFPTLSRVFRIDIHAETSALDYVPMAISLVWAVWYYFSRESWDWNRDGLLLLLVSVLVAPYAWFSDETVLLPVIIAGLAARSGRYAIPYVVMAVIALGEVFHGFPMRSWWYIWTPLAWLLWYLWVIADCHRSRRSLRRLAV